MLLGMALAIAAATAVVMAVQSWLHIPVKRSEDFYEEESESDTVSLPEGVTMQQLL